jgi:hypothetical protein
MLSSTLHTPPQPLNLIIFQHCDEALETGKIARHISRCGFLFVAPDWDFTNPIYRTKRWQRRWFVLYDDGELTYSIDEHPETIPQARRKNIVFKILSHFP